MRPGVVVLVVGAWIACKQPPATPPPAGAGSAANPSAPADKGSAPATSGAVGLAAPDAVIHALVTRQLDVVGVNATDAADLVLRAGFARAWNAAWKGKVTVASIFGRALPSATTGWVGASIELAKPGYKIPFTVFAVFDKTADGTWSLVHIHFAA